VNEPLIEASGEGQGPADLDVQRLLSRAMRNTLLLGGVGSAILLFAAGWRDAGMLASGAAVSGASIWEWKRLTRLISAKLDRQKSPSGTPVVIL
jgi:hypothetical protein